MPRRFRPWFLLPLIGVLACAWAAAAADDAARYRLDPVHTRVMLAVDHAGFSKAIGTVSGTTGTLRTNGRDWTGAEVEVTVPLDRLDFGDAAWNRAVAGRGLLDTERHPVARFVSTRIEAVDDTRARVHGALTLRGVTRDVVLDVVRNGARRHPLPPFRQTVGFSATTTLSRAEFGVDAWRSMIGDAVELRLEVEATRMRATDAAAPDETAPVEPAGPGEDDDAAPDASLPDPEFGPEPDATTGTRSGRPAP